MTAAANLEFRQAMEAAAIWLARLHADDCSDQDRTAFSQWLAQDETHRRAFNSVSTAYEVAGVKAGRWQDELQRATAQADTQLWGDAQSQAHISTPAQAALPRPARVSRRKVLAGAAMLAAGTGAAGWQVAYAGTVTTGLAERKSLRLNGGYTVQMDAETTIRQPWMRSRRLELQKGRISLQTLSDDGQLFTVTTPDYEITGAAMDVDVCFTSSRLTVSVLHGNVRISQPGSNPVLLHEGERLNPQGIVDRPAMGPIIAWRNGQLIFQNSSLTEACAELNRYDSIRLVPDAKAGAMRVSGTFLMGQNKQFAKAMGELLNLETKAEGQSIYMITS
ncbi:MAG: DUF4880 domain-containing protein [Sphingobium sp.]|nr:DUF4880 domain-containing protein [Sphingobium sp.]